MSLSRRALVFALWLLFMLVLAEGTVRLAGAVLRRDQAIASGRPGATVIYCVGDSFTYGQGVDRSQAWPAVLGALLPEVTVQTLAVPGRSSSQARLEVQKALRAGDARLVLVMTGWNANDNDFAAWAAANARDVPWTATADLWMSHSRLYRVVKHALTFRSRTLVFDDAEVIPHTSRMELYDFRAYQEIARDNLTAIARMCHAAGVPCAFLTYPHQDLPPNPYTQTEYYHALFGRTPLGDADYLVQERQPGEIAIDAVIRTVSEAEGIALIDTQAAFVAAAPGGGLYLPDWHHPTAAGHRLIAETVYAAIRDRPAQ